MGFKKRESPISVHPVSKEAPKLLYGVQVLIEEDGVKQWCWGSPMYGLDTTTNLIGQHLVGSMELAIDEVKRHMKIRKPGTVRLVKYALISYHVALDSVVVDGEIILV